MTKTVAACAQRNIGQHAFFAIEFYGECWAGDQSVQNQYFSEGEADTCYAGVGAENSIYIYHFGPAGKAQ